MRACVCSILELPINEVPNFMENGYHYYDEMINDFMDSKGLVSIEFSVEKESDLDVWHNKLADSYYIAVGKSPRADINHAVVYYGNKMVHDPHKDRAGIENILYVSLILKKDPSLKEI